MELEQERRPSSDARCLATEDSFLGGRVGDYCLYFKAVFTTPRPSPCSVGRPGRGRCCPSTHALADIVFGKWGLCKSSSQIPFFQAKVPVQLILQGQLNKGLKLTEGVVLSPRLRGAARP